MNACLDVSYQPSPKQANNSKPLTSIESPGNLRAGEVIRIGFWGVYHTVATYTRTSTDTHICKYLLLPEEVSSLIVYITSKNYQNIVFIVGLGG